MSCNYAYLRKYEFDIELENDLTSFQEVEQCSNLEKWIEVIKEVMKSQ